MNINSSRNSLLRSRNLRSAKRARAGKVISSRTSSASTSSRIRSSTSARRGSSTATMTQTKQLAMYEKMEKSAYNIQVNVEKLLKIGNMSYTEDEAGKTAQENDKKILIRQIKSSASDDFIYLTGSIVWLLGYKIYNRCPDRDHTVLCSVSYLTVSCSLSDGDIRKLHRQKD